MLTIRPQIGGSFVYKDHKYYTQSWAFKINIPFMIPAFSNNK